MEYKANCAIVFRGEHVRRGAVVDMTGEEVKLYDPADITAVSADQAEEPEEVVAEVPLEEMSHAQLKERAKELGLSQAGSKADLQERIALHLAQGDAPAGDLSNQ